MTRSRFAGLVAVASLGLAAPAFAAPTRVVSSSPALQQRLQQVVNDVAAQGFPTPQTTVWVIAGGCPGQQEPACTSKDGPVYVTADASLREDFLHELGHQFDYGMPQSTRREFMRLLHLRGPWRSSGPDSPHEQFAEAYWMSIATHGMTKARAARSERVLLGRIVGGHDRLNGGYGYMPSWTLGQTISKLIRRTRSFGPEASRGK